MWELDDKENWVPKNWCFWPVVLEKTPESPLDCEEIQPVHPKGNQPWIFIGRTDAEAESLILWPCDTKNWFIGKDPDAGKDWRQEEKGTTENEIVRWYHQLDGYECEQDPGVGDGQGILMSCSPWGLKELDMTEQLNWLTEWSYWKQSTHLMQYLSKYQWHFLLRTRTNNSNVHMGAPNAENGQSNYKKKRKLDVYPFQTSCYTTMVHNQK